MEVSILNPLSDIAVQVNASIQTFDLSTNFDDPFTTGRIAAFQLADTTLGNNGIIEVVLFDQPGAGAPNSVANFRNYAEDGDYENTLIHRSIPNFIIQGGGFTVDENLNVSDVPSDPPVENEFSTERSNLRGTIAFAKVGGDPDSATSQWFFNLADNSENLDNQNGGFTVFGEVVGSEDLATIDAIADLPVFNATNLFNEPAFTDVPADVDPTNPILNSREDLVLFNDISIFEVAELEFTATNSNPDLVSASVTSDGELVLDYQPGQVGTAEITIEATNLLGETASDTFNVTVNGEAGTTLDIDGNGSTDALTDGILIFRHLFGLTDNALTQDAIAPDATRTNTEIETYLASITESGLDIDGNGSADALTDGILVFRHLFGLTGEALTQDAIAPDATRTQASGVESYLDSLTTTV